MAEQVSLLVVALDADLRDDAFDRLTTAGYRVDAVADLASARKRLAKDEYALIVRAGELEAVNGASPTGAPVPELTFDESSIAELVESARSTLNEP